MLRWLSVKELLRLAEFIESLRARIDEQVRQGKVLLLEGAQRQEIHCAKG